MDIATVERARSGDADAFVLIYEHFSAQIHRYVFRLLGNQELADDITQETFLRAFQGISKISRDSNVSAWLYRIASNESLTFLEQRKKKAAIPLSDVEAGLSNTIKADKNFDANKLEWKLQAAIQKLPEKQRVVFNLRYYDEMPYEEMSRILDTSEGALKASYHHAIKKIEEFILNS